MPRKEKPKEQAAILLKAAAFDLIQKRANLQQAADQVSQQIQGKLNELRKLEGSEDG